MISIDISNQQSIVAVDEDRMRSVAHTVLADAGIHAAQISIAIVDDRAIRPLNRKYLDHDFATDVLSFVLEQNADHLEGEVVASAETAARVADGLDWTADDELLLYVVHGVLHLVGHDDATDQQRDAMRELEREILDRFGLKRQDDPGA